MTDSPQRRPLLELVRPNGVVAPYRAYESLRSDGPLTWHSATRTWIATGYEVISHLLRDNRLSSDYRKSPAHERWLGRTAIPGAADAMLSKTLLFMDPPRHTELRGLVTPTFSTAAVSRLRSEIEARALALVSEFDGRVDAVKAFSRPLSTSAICSLLGVPHEDESHFANLSRELAGILEVDMTSEGFLAAAEATLELTRYFLDLFARRRVEPRSDLVSALVAHEAAGTLSSEELLMLCILLLSAGQQTTMDLTSSCLYLLATNAEAQASVAADPSLARTAVDEGVRCESPIQLAFRTVISTVELGAYRLEPGTQVVLLLGAGNRDPQAFPEPDRFMLTRPTTPSSLGFGGGIHYCVGSVMARMVASVAMETVTQHRSLALDEAPVWRESASFRGAEALLLA